MSRLMDHPLFPKPVTGKIVFLGKKWDIIRIPRSNEIIFGLVKISSQLFPKIQGIFFLKFKAQSDRIWTLYSYIFALFLHEVETFKIVTGGSLAVKTFFQMDQVYVCQIHNQEWLFFNFFLRFNTCLKCKGYLSYMILYLFCLISVLWTVQSWPTSR